MNIIEPNLYYPRMGSLTGFRVGVVEPKRYTNTPNDFTLSDEYRAWAPFYDRFCKQYIDLLVVCSSLESVQEKYNKAVEVAPELEFTIMENIL